MMNIIKKMFSFVVLSIFCTGCASIIHGTKQQIPVTSNPSGVTVSDGIATTQTPAIFEIKRDRDCILTFSKPGYKTETVRLTRVIAGATLGNIIAGGFIGWGVDAVSGAQWKHVPETVDITMHKLTKEESAAEFAQEYIDSPEKKIKQLEALRDQKMITEEEFAATKAVTEKIAASAKANAENPQS